MMDFSDFIEESQLVDLPLGEGQYTWSRGLDNPAISQIDRFFLSLLIGRILIWKLLKN
jgi:hypothetical protein